MVFEGGRDSTNRQIKETGFGEQEKNHQGKRGLPKEEVGENKPRKNKTITVDT